MEGIIVVIIILGLMGASSIGLNRLKKLFSRKRTEHFVFALVSSEKQGLGKSIGLILKKATINDVIKVIWYLDKGGDYLKYLEGKGKITIKCPITYLVNRLQGYYGIYKCTSCGNIQEEGIYNQTQKNRVSNYGFDTYRNLGNECCLECGTELNNYDWEKRDEE
jgi:hypothetical protein